jgi:hypothetical protein
VIIKLSADYEQGVNADVETKSVAPKCDSECCASERFHIGKHTQWDNQGTISESLKKKVRQGNHRTCSSRVFPPRMSRHSVVLITGEGGITVGKGRLTKKE